MPSTVTETPFRVLGNGSAGAVRLVTPAKLPPAVAQAPPVVSGRKLAPLTTMTCWAASAAVRRIGTVRILKSMGLEPIGFELQGTGIL